jgi:hypothetical protein
VVVEWAERDVVDLVAPDGTTTHHRNTASGKGDPQ